MKLIEIIMNPISIVFTVFVVGYFVGCIKCFGISLDLSGVLIVAVIMGYIINSFDILSDVIDIHILKANMQSFSALGTSLFVAVIGLTTGYSLNINKAKEWKAAIVGFFMVASSFGVMNLIAMFDEEINYSRLLGAFCGALTTSPGLAVAIELDGMISEEVMLGYGCTYLLGVILTVLSVQFITPKHKKNIKKENSVTESNKYDLGGLIQIGIAVVVGSILGNLHLGNFSLGRSGGILGVGIVLGAFMNKLPKQKRVSETTMWIYRNFGLILFFVGNGVPAGMSFNNNFDIRIVLYGVLMTITPIAVGIFFSALVLREKETSTIVAGGMTSSPAIGILLQKQNYVNLSKYSIAYVVALFTVVILIRFL